MRKIVPIISILLCVLSVHAQDIPMLKNLPLAELPKEISYKGEFLSCTVWTDKLGENYLITHIIQRTVCTALHKRRKALFCFVATL